MQTDRQPKETEAVHTETRPTYPLISNQPERFGALSEAFLFVEERRLYDLIEKVKKIAVMVAIGLLIPIAICIAIRINNNEYAGMMLDVVKIMFVYVLFAAIAALVAIGVYRKKIFLILAQMEELANFGDDLTRFYMPYLRSELRELNDKLNRHKHAPDIPSGFEVARDLWPIISLIIKRDPNILKWGQVGLKTIRTLKAFFGHNTNNHQEKDSTSKAT